MNKKILIFLLTFNLLSSNLHAQIQAVGDTMLGTNPTIANFLLNPVQDIFSQKGYINLINLEGVITSNSYIKKCTSGPHCYVFQMPDKIAEILAGNNIHIANLANNHSMDLGSSGQLDTAKILLKHGVAPIGMLQKYTEKIVKLNEKEYVFIGISPHKNTFSIFDKEGLNTLIESHKQAKRLVVVTAHMGAEGENAYKVQDKEEIFLGSNRGNPIRIARNLIDSGADLFIGHGPHVMRPIEVYKDRLIVYSLGNFLTYGAFNLNGNSGLGGLIRIYMEDDGKFKEGKFFGFQQTKSTNNKIWLKGIALEKSMKAQNFIQKLTDIHQAGKFKWDEDGKFYLVKNKPSP